MKKIKDGNTTIIFNDEYAAKTPEEIQAVLDEASRVVTNSLINAAIKKQGIVQ